VNEFPLAYARRTLLFSLVSVGMGFTVLFPVLAPLGREIGLSEFQITAVIAASSLTVSSRARSGPHERPVGPQAGHADRALRLHRRHGALNSVLYAGLSGLLAGWASSRRSSSPA